MGLTKTLGLRCLVKRSPGFVNYALQHHTVAMTKSILLEILASTGCSSVSVVRLYGSSQRRARSHGHRQHNRPSLHDAVIFDYLHPYIQQPLGLHHIRTNLYALLLSKLQIHCTDIRNVKSFSPNTPGHKLTGKRYC